MKPGGASLEAAPAIVRSKFVVAIEATADAQE